MEYVVLRTMVDLEKRMNELARDGWKLAEFQGNVVIMERERPNG